MFKLRQATLLDLLVLAPLAELYANEAAKHNNFPVDLEHTLSNAARSISMENGCFLVCYTSDLPVGFIWGHCTSLPWSKAKLAIDNILYVKPEFRKHSPVGFRLMKGWYEWAKEQGAVEIQISCASGIHEDSTNKFFERLGYKAVGTQYRMEI